MTATFPPKDSPAPHPPRGDESRVPPSGTPRGERGSEVPSGTADSILTTVPSAVVTARTGVPPSPGDSEVPSGIHVLVTDAGPIAIVPAPRGRGRVVPYVPAASLAAVQHRAADAKAEGYAACTKDVIAFLEWELGTDGEEVLYQLRNGQHIGAAAKEKG